MGETHDTEVRKTPLRFWNSRWVPQQLFQASRRDLSATPVSKMKAVEFVDLSAITASLASVPAVKA